MRKQIGSKVFRYNFYFVVFAKVVEEI